LVIIAISIVIELSKGDEGAAFEIIKYERRLGGGR
jgi:hypothetical protein